MVGRGWGGKRPAGFAGARDDVPRGTRASPGERASAGREATSAPTPTFVSTTPPQPTTAEGQGFLPPAGGRWTRSETPDDRPRLQCRAAKAPSPSPRRSKRPGIAAGQSGRARPEYLVPVHCGRRGREDPPGPPRPRPRASARRKPSPMKSPRARERTSDSYAAKPARPPGSQAGPRTVPRETPRFRDAPGTGGVAGCSTWNVGAVDGPGGGAEGTACQIDRAKSRPPAACLRRPRTETRGLECRRRTAGATPGLKSLP